MQYLYKISLRLYKMPMQYCPYVHRWKYIVYSTTFQIRHNLNRQCFTSASIVIMFSCTYIIDTYIYIYIYIQLYIYIYIYITSEG